MRELVLPQRREIGLPPRPAQRVNILAGVVPGSDCGHGGNLSASATID
jgi:hypothetical protein